VSARVFAAVVAGGVLLAACTSAGVATKAGTTSTTTTTTTMTTTTVPAPPPPPVELSASKGETSLPSGLVRDGGFTRAVVVDGGRLVVEPLPASAVLPVTLSRAKGLVAAAQSGEGDGWGAAELIGAGVVTIDPALTKGLPRYERRAAWVAFAAASGSVRVASSNTPQPSFEVIVLDADTGDDVLVYESAGLGICGGPVGCTPAVHGPSVSAASEIVSIPWTAAGERPDPYEAGRVDWLISYTLPRCAAVFDSPGVYYAGSAAGPATLYVDVEIPMVPTRSCSAAHTTTSVFGPETGPISSVRHAPVGAGVSGG
jgi:hypothetical protein